MPKNLYKLLDFDESWRVYPGAFFFWNSEPQDTTLISGLNVLIIYNVF